MAGIPGLDVTELGQATPKGLRAAGFDMGPGNAQVPPAGSAQAQAFRASTAPVAPPAVDAAQAGMRATRTGVINSARAVGQGLRAAGRASLPAVAGSMLAAGQRVVDGRDAAMAEPFVPAPAQPGEIPHIPDPRYAVPAAAPVHPLGFGPDNEFTRNVANTLNAVPGTGALTGLARAGGYGMRMLQGAQVAQQVVRGAQAATPPAQEVASPTTGGPVNTAPIYSDAREGPAVPPTLPQRPGSLASGFSYTDKTPHPGTVSSLDTIGFDGYKRQLDNIRSLGGDDGSAPSTPQAAGGFGGGTLSSGLREIANSQNLGPGVKERMGLNGNNGADRRQAAQIAADRAAASVREGGENYRQGVRESGENARLSTREGGENYRSDRGLRTQMTINDRRIGAELRGQDITREGHLLTNANARTRLQYDMGKDARDFGAQQVERDRSAVEAANKSWQSEAESRFRTTGPDGKDVPDHARIAMFNAAVDTSIPSFIKMLQATGTPAALKKAQDLSTRGRAALGSEDKDLMQRLLDKRETIRQTHGMLPGTSNYVHSDDLLGYLPSGTDPHLVGSDSEVTRNGSKVRRDKLVYGKDANVFLPNFQPPSTNLTGLR